MKNHLKINDQNVENYLTRRLESDYEVLRQIIGSNDHYIFVHSILFELPEFLIDTKQTEKPTTHKIRDDFEISFEKTLVQPKLDKIDEIINKFKHTMTPKDSVDELQLILNEVDNDEFHSNVVPKYPLIRQMRMIIKQKKANNTQV